MFRQIRVNANLHFLRIQRFAILIVESGKSTISNKLIKIQQNKNSVIYARLILKTTMNRLLRVIFGGFESFVFLLKTIR